jgi:hypothetical protein
MHGHELQTTQILTQGLDSHETRLSFVFLKRWCLVLSFHYPTMQLHTSALRPVMHKQSEHCMKQETCALGNYVALCVGRGLYPRKHCVVNVGIRSIALLC